MEEVVYDEFLAHIYDDSPCFGRARNQELDKFNNPYYENLKHEQGTILEFGSGTGLLAVPLAQRGYRIDCVDISPYMHDVIREKLHREPADVKQNIRLIVGDALTYTALNRYSSIVMSEGIIIALPSVEQQTALLKNCNRNLVIGGKLYFDCFQPNYKIIQNRNILEYTRFRTKNRDLYVMKVNYNNNEYTQVQKLDITYTKMDKGLILEEVNVKVLFRYIFYSEINLMLKMAGFRPSIDTQYADGRGFFVIAKKVSEV